MARMSMRSGTTNETEVDGCSEGDALDLGRGSDRDRSLSAGAHRSPLSLERGCHGHPIGQARSHHQNARLLEVRFRVMSTEAGLWLHSAHPEADLALCRAATWLQQLERQLTRFSPHSELSGLNARAGQGAVAVSALLYEVVEAALGLARWSGGLFEPTMLPHLVRAGYGPGLERGKVDYKAVRLYPDSLSVELEEGVALDLGGVAKGWAADRLAQHLEGFGSVLVDLGGDLACRGARRWRVGVQDPHQPDADLCELELDNEAVATSSTLKRRWAGGHHLIDPRHGTPSTSDVVAATVLAPAATLAEGAAKTALLLGESHGKEFLLETGLRGILVKSDGSMTKVSL